MTDTITVGGLCSGIGGLELGLERAGMSIIWQSEVDPYCNTILAKHWPNLPNLGDIKKIDWTNVERPDLICGGYPCQPFSLAGRRRGEDDPRHLWPFVADAIRHLRPRWVLLENVYGHLSKGFGAVVGELAEIGYDAEWDCIPAAAVGAPHIRDRVFIVAYPNTHSRRREGQQEPHIDSIEPRFATSLGYDLGGFRDDVAHADRPRLAHLQGGEAFAKQSGRRAACGAGWWDVEPDVGRVADGIPKRVDRLRGLGNAVVPQVAQYIGSLIVEADQRREAA